MKRVYLDQNHWINLLRAREAGDGETYDLYKKLKEKVESGEIEIVISMLNFKEAIKMKDALHRKKLMALMYELSRWRTIMPAPAIKEIEINNVLVSVSSFKPIDVEKVIFGEKLLGLVGAVGITAQTKEEETKALEALNSADFSQKMIESEAYIERSIAQDKEIEVIVGEMERIRKVEQIKTPNQNDRALVFIADSLLDQVIFLHLKHAVSFEKLWGLINGRQKVLDLFKKMPCLYCFFHLSDARDKDLNRPVKENDTYDIRALSIAIPYCDITMADAFFTQAARQEKLDTLFGKKVIASLQELKALL